MLRLCCSRNKASATLGSAHILERSVQQENRLSRVQGATSDTSFELQSAFDRSQQRHVERTLWVMMMVVGLIVGGFFLASAGNAGALAS